MNKEIIIHVGLHKSGTTFLQELVFPYLSDVHFIHAEFRRGQHQNPINELIENLLFDNHASIDTESERVRIARWMESLKENKILISCEALIGSPFDNHQLFKSLADMLKAVFPSAKILFVFRRQDKWLESAYHQILRAGFSQSLNKFLNYRDGHFGGYELLHYHGPNWAVSQLDWSAFLAYYQKVFGTDQVLGLSFESFVSDQASFLKTLYDFIQVEAFYPEKKEAVNVGFSPLSARLAQLTNAIPMPIKLFLKKHLGSQWHPSHVANRYLDPLLKSKKRFIDPKLAREIMALHQGNNQRLETLCQQDLKQYGYYS